MEILVSGFEEENHFTNSDTIADAILGVADGLTVPFALAAGISGAVESMHIIITAGFAEIAAGAISMGLGGFLASRTYEDHYKSERKRELYEIDHMRERERDETREIFAEYGLKSEVIEEVLENLEQDKEVWADFMMRYELNLEKPKPKKAMKSAITIGGAYVIGGIIPLSPYIILDKVNDALIVSCITTLTALTVFGWIKGKLIGISPWKSSGQMVGVGGIAAGVAYGVAYLIAG